MNTRFCWNNSNLLNIPHVNNSATAWWCQCCMGGQQNECRVRRPMRRVDSDLLHLWSRTRCVAGHCNKLRSLQVDSVAGRRAPSHTARNTITYGTCGVRMSFIESEITPSSPDLNPWIRPTPSGELQERIRHDRKFDGLDPVDQSTQATVLECLALPQPFTRLFNYLH